MMEKLHINVVLENVRSALNVGAIFRTCEATGVESLHLTGITPYPPHNKIPKTALGSIENVNWIQEKSTDRTIETLRGNGNKIISIETGERSKNLYNHIFEYPSTIIFGHEITGISQETLEKADEILYIPMFGSKESLNVATSCGIVLYEIVRQFYYNH